jgi:dTDP-4-amino-4,6-dideoxygalactose transaminase
MSALPQTAEPADDIELPAEGLVLAEPDVGDVELQLVQAALRQPSLSGGAMTTALEERFAASVGRAYAVAVASGTLGTWLALRALGIGPGHEVIASPYGWLQVAHAVTLCGARLVLSDINYWSGCLDPARAAPLITPATRAVIVGNVNGHPAAWDEWQALARDHGLSLIEDSTEAIGSVYRGRSVGSFGDVAVFDFAAPSLLGCGEGGLLVTDDAALASELRYLRQRSLHDRRSVSVGARVPLQAGLSEVTAALLMGQLVRLPQIVQRRQAVVDEYLLQMQSFEGIKPPYVAQGVEQVNWMVFMVHLGKRFTASACNQIIEDLAEEEIEAVLYCQPLHQQFAYAQQGFKRGQFPLAERIADRAIALPLHGQLKPEHVQFIVKTLKDSSVNVGAGAAIY